MTKTEKMLRLIRKNPDMNARDAVGKGYSEATFYTAKKKLREQEPRPEVDQPRQRQHEPLVELMERLEEMGIIELHYKDHELEVIRRQRVIGHGS